MKRIAPANQAHSENVDDAALIQRVLRRDHQAMVILFDRYAGMVFSIAFRVLKEEPPAEDVVQEIFSSIWQFPERYVLKSGTSLGNWLAISSRNRSIDVLRGRRPLENLEDLELLSPEDLAEEVLQKDRFDQARAAALQLPAEQREALELSFYEGMTHAEIAKATGTPLGTVKTRLRLALRDLRKAFRQQ